MQDGAPPHFGIVVREWLNAQIPGRCMGRHGSQEWPARSPELTPCDFFLWGWLKEESTQPNQEIWKNLKGEYEKL